MEQAKVQVKERAPFRRDMLRSALSGTLLGIGFVVPAVWWISFVGLVPFLWKARDPSRGVFGSFLTGWLIGLVLHCFALYAIFWHTLPLDWYGLNSQWIQIAAVGVSWFLASAVLAIGTGLFGLALQWIRRDSAGYIFTIPALWVICECISSFIFSIASAGPGFLIGPHFTLGYLGYLLANDTVLLQAASFGGIYALSFIVVVVNTLVYRLLVANSLERQWLLVTSAILLSIFVLGHSTFDRFSHDTGDTYVSIAAVSTYNPPLLHLTTDEERSRFEQLQSFIKEISTTTEAILLPESATFLRGFPERESSKISALIVDSENIVEADSFIRSYAVFQYSDGRTERSSKQFLLPLGESLPYLYRAFLSFATPEFRAQVLRTRAYVSGNETRFANLSNASISVRFCDEVMSPYLYSSDISEGAHILANLASHSWFHGSHLVYQQMQNVAKVRAVESRRWYIQSGNMVPAFAVDSYGRLVGETEWGTSQVLSVRAPVLEERTAYSRLIGWGF